MHQKLVHISKNYKNRDHSFFLLIKQYGMNPKTKVNNKMCKKYKPSYVSK